MTETPLDLRNSAGRSRRNNDSPTPRSPSIPPGNVYKPDRALATQFTISKSNDQPARRALVLDPLDSRSPFEGVLPGAPLFISRRPSQGGRRARRRRVVVPSRSSRRIPEIQRRNSHSGSRFRSGRQSGDQALAGLGARCTGRCGASEVRACHPPGVEVPRE